MNSAHAKTLAVIFSTPVPRSLAYRRVESLLLGLGCVKVEKSGSRVSFHKDGETLDLHRPHPDKEVKPYQVRLVRDFLERTGETP